MVKSNRKPPCEATDSTQGLRIPPQLLQASHQLMEPRRQYVVLSDCVSRKGQVLQVCRQSLL